MASSALPEGIPVLARGRHRTPRRGACFMEFASFLAGERWSDHPACTHPLLGQLARQVNDQISDAGRQQLTPLIPTVVGRRGDDLTWLRLPVAVAASSILQVPEATQRALAAGLLRAVEVCADLGSRRWPGRAAGGDRSRAGSPRGRLGRATGGARPDHCENVRRTVLAHHRQVHGRRCRGVRRSTPRCAVAHAARGGDLGLSPKGTCPDRRHLHALTSGTTSSSWSLASRAASWLLHQRIVIVDDGSHCRQPPEQFVYSPPIVTVRRLSSPSELRNWARRSFRGCTTACGAGQGRVLDPTSSTGDT